MTDFRNNIDKTIASIKGIIDGLEALKPKPELDMMLGILGREELLRAKISFERLAMQQLEYQERKKLEGSPTVLPLEAWLKTKEYKSEYEKDLLTKVYTFNNKVKETAIIPMPLKAIKRIIINGKPYVEFNGGEGKARVLEEIGKTLV